MNKLVEWFALYKIWYGEIIEINIRLKVEFLILHEFLVMT